MSEREELAAMELLLKLQELADRVAYGQPLPPHASDTLRRATERLVAV